MSTTARSLEKRRRAAEFQPRPGPTPNSGVLDVQWSSAFDRSCFLVTTPGLAAKHQAPYENLMQELRAETGCTEAEILAHGNKVRALLFFAEDRMAKTGPLPTGRSKLAYELRPVTPAF